MALVIVGHGGAAPLLHRQPGLGAVERPCSCQGQAVDLAFLVDAEHHRMGRWIDPRVRPVAGPRAGSEADDILELVGEFGVVGDLEGTDPMRLQPLPLPDAPHRGRADPRRLGHRRGGPMGRRMRRGLIGQRHHPIDGRGRQRRDARRPGLVAGEPLDPLMHEALLPAPHHCLVLADPAGDVSVRGRGGKSGVSARRAQCPITWSSARA